MKTEEKSFLTNLKANWYFPISALTYFVLSATFTKEFIIAILLAFVLSFYFAGHFESFVVKVKNEKNAIKAIAAVSSLGTVMVARESFAERILSTAKLASIRTMLGIGEKLPVWLFILTVIAMLIAAVCVFIFTVFVYEKFEKVFSSLFKDMSKLEICICGLIVLLLMIQAFTFFYRSRAGWLVGINDTIFTMDSDQVIREKAYLSLYAISNDIRQPLFGVFAAPIMGIPYLIGKLFVGTEVYVYLIHGVEIILIMLCALMISKMMKFGGALRVIFIALYIASFPSLLFSIVMEQYAVAVFYLICFVYLWVLYDDVDKYAFVATAGTLTTGLAFAPFMSKHNPFKEFKLWFKDMWALGITYLLALIGLCRIDSVLSVFMGTGMELGDFAGSEVGFFDQVCQYFYFIRTCFISPEIIGEQFRTRMLMKQGSPTSINILGVAILIICIWGFIVTNKERLSRIAFGWIVFSALIMVVIGWGAAENGMVIYSLYFSWAFIVLFVQFLKWICNKMGTAKLLVILLAILVIALVVFNVPNINKIINMCVENYPRGWTFGWEGWQRV